MDAHVTTTPATARTDLPRQEPAHGSRSLTPRRVRRLGLTLTAGTLLWAASIFAFGTLSGGIEGRIGDLTGLAFQIGVLSLLTVQIRTQATGTSRAARVMLKVELVLLVLASIWSFLHGVLPEPAQNSLPIMILDVFWPLSMLGMMVIGIKLAFAGRWRGLLRWWPLIAETWALVTIPASIVLGEDGATWVGGGHLVIGYATLGVLLALRPHLVLQQDNS